MMKVNFSEKLKNMKEAAVEVAQAYSGKGSEEIPAEETSARTEPVVSSADSEAIKTDTASVPLSLKELKNRLDEIEYNRGKTDGHIANMTRKLTKKLSADEQIIELLNGFSIPDKKEELLDFIKLTKTNQRKVSAELRGKLSKNAKANKGSLFALWGRLHEYAYNKALTNFPDDPAVIKMRQARENTGFKAIIEKYKYFAMLGGLVAALLLFLGVKSATRDSHTEPIATVTETELSSSENVAEEEDISRAVPVAKEEASSEKDISDEPEPEEAEEEEPVREFDYKKDVPAYDGSVAFVEVNDDHPFFTKADYEIKESQYTKLDSIGRAAGAITILNADSIVDPKPELNSDIVPAGWTNDRKHFSRANLIPGELGGDVDSEMNYYTATDYMLSEAMNPALDEVKDYLGDNNGDLLYRVTPVFSSNNKLSDGLLLEASSVDDRGSSFEKCIFCYNVNPDIDIDYKTGKLIVVESEPAPSQKLEADAEAEVLTPVENIQQETTETSKAASTVEESVPVASDSSPTVTETANTSSNTTQSPLPEVSVGVTYILNARTGTFHRTDARCVNNMSLKNRVDVSFSRDEMIARGYTPCGNCNP